jgi:hypothetical protein
MGFFKTLRDEFREWQAVTTTPGASRGGIMEPDPVLVSAQQIHEEIYAANESTLQELLASIERHEAAKELGDDERQSLSQLGFRNVPSVAGAIELEHVIKRKREMVSAIQHYRDFYPQYKFVSVENLVTIMGKYNLVMGWPEIFRAEIPDRNRKEIAAFRLHRATVNSGMTASTEFVAVQVDWYGVRQEHTYVHRDEPVVVVGQVTDFDMKERYVGENRMIGERKVSYHPPRPKFVTHDPIVLQSVRYGYLVITAWGPEAEAVVNENRN